jgi:hypothetical protein
MRVIARNINSLNYTLDYDNYKFNEAKVRHLLEFSLDDQVEHNPKAGVNLYTFFNNMYDAFFTFFYSEKTA